MERAGISGGRMAKLKHGTCVVGLSGVKNSAALDLAERRQKDLHHPSQTTVQHHIFFYSRSSNKSGGAV